MPSPLQCTLPDTESSVAALQAEVLRGEAAFAQVRGAWQGAIGRMVRPSLFVTPQFLELSWRHLSKPGDEPWLVVVRQAGVLVGLLPLVLRRDVQARVLRKVLVHMGESGGDRPGIVHTIEPDRVWQAALRAVVQQRKHWQVLDLRELDAGAWPLGEDARALLQDQHGLSCRLRVCTHAGYLPIQGGWDHYLARRSRNTRQGYGRAERRLREAHPDVRIEVHKSPDQIVPALERYLAIDAKSWKHAAGIEFWKDASEQRFFKALLLHLAAQGQASVWLLSTGEVDMAGLVRFQQGRVMYERCSTYDPAYARFSPSTYLCMQAVRQLFEGGGFDESDVLGLPEPLADRLAIRAWYPGERRTSRLTTLNAPLWWRLAQGLKEGFAGLRSRGISALQLSAPAKPMGQAGPHEATPALSEALHRIEDDLIQACETTPAAPGPAVPSGARPASAARTEKPRVEA